MSSHATASGLDVALLRGDRSLISDLASEWDALILERDDADPFSTPVWIGAWLDAFAPDARLVLIVVRRGGVLRGLLPLVERRSGFQGHLLTRLSSPTNYHSGRIDLVRGAGDDQDVVSAIWDAMFRRLRWDMLDYRDVTEGSGFADLVTRAGQAGSQIIRRETLCSPFIEFSADSDLGTFGPSKQLRRSRRMLDKEGGVTFRRTAPADPASLQRLVLQEDAGWKGAAGTAIAREPEALAFYRALVAAQSSSFTVVINELVVNEQPIAINFGFEMGSRYFGLKRTYDEAFHKSGPGHLITQEILLDLPNRGIFEFDIMGHNEAYKMEWTSLVRQHHHYLVFRPGLKGGLLRRGVDVAIPLVKTLRTRFAQRGLAVGRTGNDTSSTDAAKS